MTFCERVVEGIHRADELIERRLEMIQKLAVARYALDYTREGEEHPQFSEGWSAAADDLRRIADGLATELEEFVERDMEIGGPSPYQVWLMMRMSPDRQKLAG